MVNDRYQRVGASVDWIQGWKIDSTTSMEKIELMCSNLTVLNNMWSCWQITRVQSHSDPYVAYGKCFISLSVLIITFGTIECRSKSTFLAGVRFLIDCLLKPHFQIVGSFYPPQSMLFVVLQKSRKHINFFHMFG